jgi:phospholipase/carboxylesterase
MITTRRSVLGVLAQASVGAVAVPGVCAADDPVTPGQHRLELGDRDRDGLLYVPRGYSPAVASSLWVVLHGAAGTAQSTAYTFSLADEFGVLLLAPESRDERTWDGVLRSWGPDVEFIAAGVNRMRTLFNVDRRRMTVAGFSDGASYALSLGISYGDQFSRIVAMSPGVMQPMAARGKPRIFISHGISDAVMPIDETSRRFVPRLKALGYDVTYREYEGRHTVSPPIVREAFRWEHEIADL